MNAVVEVHNLPERRPVFTFHESSTQFFRPFSGHHGHHHFALGSGSGSGGSGGSTGGGTTSGSSPEMESPAGSLSPDQLADLNAGTDSLSLGKFR